MSKRSLALLSLALTSAGAFAQKAVYAPTAPPMLVNTEKAKSVETLDVAQAGAQFSIGDPTDDEQMYLELINRARVDPNAEALRLIALAATNQDVFDQFVTGWHVDAELMKTQFAALPPAPPLSFNAKLIAAARGHSQYQFDNAIQSHSGSGGSTVGQRITASGYIWGNIGENVFLNATSPEHGHAGFNIDWGPGVGGMQTPAGHRATIHSSTYTEVGIGVVNGTKTVNGNDSGPQVVTQDFGRPQTATTYITGVAYYDINGNNFYDLGEGLPGVQVKIDGVSTFAVTTTSGGYSVPVPPNRTHTVRFTASGRTEDVRSVDVATANVKLDYKPAYVPPIGMGPSTAYVGVDSVYNIAPLPGATGYRVRFTELAAIEPEGFEGEVMGRWELALPGDYPYISTAVRASGASSLHLGQAVVDGTVHPQTVRFRDEILVGDNARIDFQSRMRVASPAQFAALEVSSDGGVNWTRVWSQNGGGQPGESTFSAKSGNLAQFAGQTVQIRFIFDSGNGSVFVLPDPSQSNFNSVGWFLDAVAFVNLQTVGSITDTMTTEAKFVFRPTASTTGALQFQTVVGARAFEFGPALPVTVQANPPSLSLFKSLSLSPTTATVEFLVSGGSPTSFKLESASSVTGPWSIDNNATMSSQGGGLHAFSTARTGDVRFYRVTAQ